MNSGSGTIIMLILMIVIFYVFLMLPENRKKKKLNEMRDSLRPGDDITTIGGIMGKVVHVDGDKFVMETGADQVRIELAKWALSTNDTAAERAKEEAKKAEEAKAKAKAQKKAEKNK
jgi:preprotein translocase subunit YajC